jgi:hypothetical protein
MNGSHVCEVCELVCSNAHGLTIHRMKMHGFYELTCRLCGVGLTDNNWLPYLKKKRHRVCASCWKERDKIYQHRRNHSDKARLRSKRYTQHIKQKVIGHYSASLACQCSLRNCWHGDQPCHVSDIRALSINHINGGGTRQTESIRREGSSFYRWLINRRFPEGYQVLCHNCNRIKAEVKGELLRRPNRLVTG